MRRQHRFGRLVGTALAWCGGAALVVAQPAPGGSPAPVPLVYAGSDSFAPWEFRGAGGQPDGFNVALVHALARHTGRPITVRLGPWVGVVHDLETGQVDLAALAASTSRRTRFDYLAYIWTLQQAALSRADRGTPVPERLTDMAREVVAVEQRSIMHDLLEEVPEVGRPALLLVDSPMAAVQRVLDGTATLALGNAVTLGQVVREQGAPSLAQRDVKAIAYHFATRAGRSREFAWLEPALAQLKENGTFTQLFDAYFVPRPTSTSPSLPTVVLGVAVVLAFGAVFVLWSRRMHHLVATKARAEALAARRRAEAEEALRATERQLQRLVHSVKAIVWRRDVSTQQFTFVSQEAEQLLGYPVAQWTDRPDFFTQILHADDRDWVMRYGRRATAEHRDHTMEYRVFAQDGRLVWLRDIVSVILEQGQPRELIGVMVDISEYKATEEALETAHAQALAATRAKSEFLASMSHEIRTPMNAVIGLTDLLLDTSLTADQRQLVETVRTSGDVLLNVINDILDFSKVESGRLEFEHIALDPESLVEDVARLMGQRAAGKGLDLAAHVASDVPRNLIGDPGRIRQVLLNLVGNAIKFTEHGDIAIRVKAPHVGDTHATLRFEVADTGIGIAPEAQGRLFEAFTQADASTTRRFGGTGLGLAISRRLVELLGGNIGLESTPGVGTTFWFTLPCARAGAVLPSVDAPALGGTRVLVVDDSRASRVMLEQTLLDAGLSVQVAGSAEEALALVADGPWPHVALIDEGLGGEGGMRLAEQLRARAPHAVGLLLLSARLTGGLGSHDGHRRLLKPVRRADLITAIERLRRPGLEAALPAAADGGAVERHQAASVLVAEDNPVNQKVARLMLERCGCHVTVVENGALAVAAVETGGYDLVLMDCQMPVVDGFEATRRIRALEASVSAVPIVALTANALAGDRERCLAAGMNDYLAKPVRKDELTAMLGRQLPTHTWTPTAA